MVLPAKGTGAAVGVGFGAGLVVGVTVGLGAEDMVAADVVGFVVDVGLVFVVGLADEPQAKPESVKMMKMTIMDDFTVHTD
ncbi:MAG: hypothetical protein HYX90_09195 [Chloroflexi bacterium]|nr:hypothetical protein [Chloroflexota bacterium]